jgi:hypothetical protein
MWSMLRCYEQGTKLVFKQFCIGSCEYRTWACEAEKSPLLEAVAMGWLVKTQQAGKGLPSAVVICELCLEARWYAVQYYLVLIFYK